jgi:hypothetical protein
MPPRWPGGSLVVVGGEYLAPSAGMIRFEPSTNAASFSSVEPQSGYGTSYLVSNSGSNLLGRCAVRRENSLSGIASRSVASTARVWSRASSRNTPSRSATSSRNSSRDTGPEAPWLFSLPRHNGGCSSIDSSRRLACTRPTPSRRGPPVARTAGAAPSPEQSRPWGATRGRGHETPRGRAVRPWTRGRRQTALFVALAVSLQRRYLVGQRLVVLPVLPVSGAPGRAADCVGRFQAGPEGTADGGQ